MQKVRGSNPLISIDFSDLCSIVRTLNGLGFFVALVSRISVHDRPVSINLAQLAYDQQEIIGSGGYQPEDVLFILDSLSSGEYDLQSIITHEFPLDEIATALDTASQTDQALHVSLAHAADSSA